MRWYKIEFFSWGTMPEKRIRVEERQYSSSRKALVAADRMALTMNKKGIACNTYTVKPL